MGTRHFWFSPRFQRHQHIIATIALYPMTNVPRGSIRYGDIISEVNGNRIRTLKDFKDSLLPDRGEKYVTFKTLGGAFVVMNLVDTLLKELRAHRLFHYPITHAVRHLYHVRWVRSALLKRIREKRRNRLRKSRSD